MYSQLNNLDCYINKLSRNGYRVGTYSEWFDELPTGDDLDVLASPVRKLIEPWLTAVFQAEHLNLLLGSGFTTAVGYLSILRPSPGQTHMSRCMAGQRLTTWSWARKVVRLTSAGVVRNTLEIVPLSHRKAGKMLGYPLEILTNVANHAPRLRRVRH